MRLDALESRFERVTLLIFNYDRCVEHFIFNQLMNQYSIGEDEAAQLVKKINIYHPYGTVGDLPWENHQEGLEFGAFPEKHHWPTPHGIGGEPVHGASQKIETFSETEAAPREFDLIKKEMELSNKVIYLGYGFHKENLKFIPKIDAMGGGSCKFYATAKGEYEGVYPDIKEIIRIEAPDRITASRFPVVVENFTCKELLQKYRISLQFR